MSSAAASPAKTIAFWWIVGPVLQVYYLLLWAYYNRQLNRAAVAATLARNALGYRMLTEGVGDEHLRQELVRADEEARQGRREQKQADQLAFQLGTIGLETAVPIKSAEREQAVAQETDLRWRTLQTILADVAPKRTPPSLLAWLGLVLGYLTGILVLYFLVVHRASTTGT